jgi:DNA invertase Pin-like site-specific DNA recombinase
MKTIIYIRTSTEEQNPENQLADCKAVCKRLNLNDFEVFEEQKSAWKNDDKREEFNKIVSLIKNRKIDNLVVWDLDRIYRNRKKQVAFFQLCKSMKVNIYSHRQHFLETFTSVPEPWNDIMRDMMVQIMGWMAEDESDKKSMRIKASIREKNGKTVSHKGNAWGRPGLSDKVKKEIIKLHEEGKSYSSISKEVYYWTKSNNKRFVTGATISNVLKEWREKND